MKTIQESARPWRIPFHVVFSTGMLTGIALSLIAVIAFTPPKTEADPETREAVKEVIKRRHPTKPDINKHLPHGDWGVDQAVQTLKQGTRNHEPD